MAVAQDLRIIGVKVDSRDAVGEVVERLDQMVQAGQATIREVATVFKRPDGRVKVHYLHSHAVLIGALLASPPHQLVYDGDWIRIGRVPLD